MFCHVRCLIVVFVWILSSIVVTLLEKGKLIALLSLDVDSVMICLLFSWCQVVSYVVGYSWPSSILLYGLPCVSLRSPV